VTFLHRFVTNSFRPQFDLKLSQNQHGCNIYAPQCIVTMVLASTVFEIQRDIAADL